LTTLSLIPLRLEVDPLAASPLPFDLERIKAHCAVDDDDFDEELALYFLAAVQAFEDTTHRTVYRRPHRWVLADFPRGDCHVIELPRGRTAKVDKIEYFREGTIQTLRGPSSTPQGADYREHLGGDSGGRLLPPHGQAWPDVDTDHPAPVVVHFEAGWQPNELPEDILRALLYRTRMSLDDERGAVDATRLSPARGAWEAMVSGWRLSRFY